MAIERTFSIIKPDATKMGVIGQIIARFEEDGLRIAAMRKTHLSKAAAESFYAEHSERPFFRELVEFMTSGPCVLMVLEGEGAILRNREIMGATNPDDAAEGTLRKRFGAHVGNNAVHGSDSPTSAAREIDHFFRAIEIF